jgi:hypothetical protein
MFVNDREMFTFSSPLDTLNKTLTWPGLDGASLEFRAKEVDKYGDFMGYLVVNLPATMLEAGKPVRFKVTGENAGSRTWFMVFQYETADKVNLTAEQAVMRGKKKNSQVLKAEIVRYEEPVEASIIVAGKKMSRTLDFGYNALYLPVPEITEETVMDLVVKAGKEILAEKSFSIGPVTPRTIYLLHHSHNDIGYTHVQTEVEKMQWANLEKALKMAALTKDYPEGAKMKFCTEVMWAVESWYDSANAEQKEAFRDAVKTGSIELNGLFANELVSLLGPEELDRMLEAGRRISGECGVDLTTAMITDIPGWSWALVPALAHSGVKYLSLGTNRGHRIGDIIEAWGDKPFYWLSPSGEEKVLCWIHGEGYSLFHTGLAYTSIQKKLQEDLVFSYMNKLKESAYPYGDVLLRYNIGSDNGPVDETLPDAVKEWNEKYVTPRIVISTVDEAFSLFEEKHGQTLPQVSGDITCYWEDGAYSTARETIMNRNVASRLTQAQTLWAMYNPPAFPEAKFRDAWRNVLYFDEHTWGSWNSISEPDSPFTLQQWELKKAFAEQAEKQSRKLFSDPLLSKILGGPASDAIEVINTCGWQRSGLVTISAGNSADEIIVSDSKGNEIPTQQLSDGNIAFVAHNISAFGSKIYTLIPKNSPNNVTVEQFNNRTIKTRNFELQIDPMTGALSSLIDKRSGRELADTTSLFGLNEYLYVEGRSPANPLQAKLKEITIVDEGPVLTTVRLDMEAPGCRSYTTTIRIVDDLGTVELINTLDKEKVTDPEAVHIAFPISVPGGKMHYDLAYGYCEPEKDQLPGSNKNFLAMEHWLDISGTEHGVTLICPDAPLFEAGAITMDEIVYGWVDELEPSSTIYSYLMNNYWETNYAASQEGIVSARYIIRPNTGFDAAKAEKEAIGQRQPLITRKGGGWQKNKTSLVTIKPDNLIITSLKPAGQDGALLISVYNQGVKEVLPKIKSEERAIFFSNPDGTAGNPFTGNEVIPPHGIRYFLLKMD